MDYEEIYKEICESDGVGSRLWRLLESLGIQHSPDCSCVLLAATMNDLGPEGCRFHHERLLKLMRKNKKKYGWKIHFKAGLKALTSGLVFKLNPFDPLPGLLHQAIIDAEQHQ